MKIYQVSNAIYHMWIVHFDQIRDTMRGTLKLRYTDTTSYFIFTSLVTSINEYKLE